MNIASVDVHQAMTTTIRLLPCMALGATRCEASGSMVLKGAWPNPHITVRRGNVARSRRDP